MPTCFVKPLQGPGFRLGRASLAYGAARRATADFICDSDLIKKPLAVSTSTREQVRPRCLRGEILWYRVNSPSNCRSPRLPTAGSYGLAAERSLRPSRRCVCRSRKPLTAGSCGLAAERSPPPSHRCACRNRKSPTEEASGSAAERSPAASRSIARKLLGGRRG
jgi:hypothetical protein